MSAPETCPTCHRPLDITFVCRDCGRTATLTFNEQRFYESKGLQPPKRCADCRRNRREQKTHAPDAAQ